MLKESRGLESSAKQRHLLLCGVLPRPMHLRAILMRGRLVSFQISELPHGREHWRPRAFTRPHEA